MGFSENGKIFKSSGSEFDYVWEKILIQVGYHPIEFSVYRFDESLSLPEKFNKLYDIFIELDRNFNGMTEILKIFLSEFDSKLYKTVDDILNLWLKEGKLDELINNILIPNKLELVESKLEFVSLEDTGDFSILTFSDGSKMIYDFGHIEDNEHVINYLNCDCENDLKKTVKWLTISHYHGDHVGNFESVVRKFDLRNLPIYLPQDPIPSKVAPSVNNNFDNVMKIIQEFNLKPYYPKENETIVLRDLKSIGGKLEKITFKNTSHNQYYSAFGEWESGVNLLDYNNCSMCLLYELGEMSIFYGSDIALEAQNFLRGKVGKVNIYRSHHHSSDFFLDEQYMLELSPDIIISSDSKVKYRTLIESKSKIGIYAQRHGIPFYPTSKNGDIKLRMTSFNFDFITLTNSWEYPILARVYRWFRGVVYPLNNASDRIENIANKLDENSIVENLITNSDYWNPFYQTNFNGFSKLIRSKNTWGENTSAVEFDGHYLDRITTNTPRSYFGSRSHSEKNNFVYHERKFLSTMIVRFNDIVSTNKTVLEPLSISSFGGVENSIDGFKIKNVYGGAWNTSFRCLVETSTSSSYYDVGILDSDGKSIYSYRHVSSNEHYTTLNFSFINVSQSKEIEIVITPENEGGLTNIKNIVLEADFIGYGSLKQEHQEII